MTTMGLQLFLSASFIRSDDHEMAADKEVSRYTDRNSGENTLKLFNRDTHHSCGRGIFNLEDENCRACVLT